MCSAVEGRCGCKYTQSTQGEGVWCSSWKVWLHVHAKAGQTEEGACAFLASWWRQVAPHPQIVPRPTPVTHTWPHPPGPLNPCASSLQEDAELVYPSPEKQDGFRLRVPRLSVVPSEVCAIVGRVGCGKCSSLACCLSVPCRPP